MQNIQCFYFCAPHSVSLCRVQIIGLYFCWSSWQR